MLIEDENGDWLNADHVWRYRRQGRFVQADVSLPDGDNRRTVCLAACDSAEAAEDRLTAIVCEVARATGGAPRAGMASVAHIDSLCR